MADSIRLQIMKSLTSLLEEVTVANGYQHDLGSNVFRGRMRLDSQDPVPAVTIIEWPQNERAEKFKPEDNPVIKEWWALAIQGFCKVNRQFPVDDVHNLMADVKKALSRIADCEDSFYHLNQLIVDFTIDGGITREPDESSSQSYFILQLHLNVIEDLRDPFNP